MCNVWGGKLLLYYPPNGMRKNAFILKYVIMLKKMFF